MVQTKFFATIGPSLWIASLLLFVPLFSMLLSPCLSRLKSYLYIELKYAESASVWLTSWEALYKYLPTIQYNMWHNTWKGTKSF